MNANLPIKVKIVSITPENITFEIIENGKLIRLQQKVFERRVEMGLFEVTNPSAIPSAF